MRCWGGREKMYSPTSGLKTFQPRRMWRSSEWDLYWIRAMILRSPELMQLLSVKSMMRYLPPKGTAGLARSAVSGCRRSPRPPARIMVRKFFMGEAIVAGPAEDGKSGTFLIKFRASGATGFGRQRQQRRAAGGDQASRGDRGGGPALAYDPQRRVLRHPRAQRLGKDHDAPPAGRVRAARFRQDHHRRATDGGRPSQPPPGQPRVPELRALPPHDRSEERRLRARDERPVGGGDRPARDRGARDGAAGREAGPAPVAAVGRGTAAGGAGPRAGEPSGRAVVGRAAGRAG